MSNDSTESRKVQSGVQAEAVPIAEVTVKHSNGGTPVTGEVIEVTLEPRFNGDTRTEPTDSATGIARFYQLANGRYDISTAATSNHGSGFKGNVNFSTLNPDDDVPAPCLHP